MSRYTAELDLVVSLGNLDQARNFLQQFGNRTGINQDTIAELVLVVDEAITNIVNHGYGGNGGPVTMTLDYQDGNLIISIQDQAPAFNPQSIAAPNLSSPLKSRAFGGMGFHLMQKFTDQLDIQPGRESGNLLTMSRRITA